ncbi:MAG TPA: NADP-dependent malic enzyme [Massilia timonae]|nr:NADP-dependent malic enzyme [Massilia timonae]
MSTDSNLNEAQNTQLRIDALEYHRSPTRGKIEVVATKPLSNQRDLSLAYSPGVAYACEEIAADPATAFDYTSRGNLVAVISNGTAVLGLGNIGPLASKPVMEGKGVLFKKFAAIDVFDIEINETDPNKLVDIIAALEPTFGGVNLEDIKAPECFYIERKLRERMKIPVFHDDQHGTAIIVGSAILNGLKVVGKSIKECKLVVSGAGAAALACLDLIVDLGFPIENIFVTDLAGVVYKGRVELMDPDKERFAQDTPHRSLADVIPGADIFLGLSAGGVLKQDMVAKMAPNPLILALANPNPEILPEDVKAVRGDAIIATGRSDYPNQVNNVLCFPYIFRGALDCGATRITDEMKLACVTAIAELAEAEASDVVALAYEGQDLTFGPEYIIPKPFDPRLLAAIAPRVAEAAAASGVATRPIADMDAYRDQLGQMIYHTGFFMKPVFNKARANLRKVAYAEAGEPRVLRAVQTVVDEGIAQPVLIGDEGAIARAVKQAGLRLQAGVDYTVIAAESDTTLQGTRLLKSGQVDSLICGMTGSYDSHLEHVRNEIGVAPGAEVLAAMNALVLDKLTLFITDTYVNETPSAQELAAITRLAADAMQHFGLEPKAALLSHSSQGSSERPSARRMREARALLAEQAPELAVIGEIHGDAALSQEIRDIYNIDAGYAGSANLLVMPSLDAANILFNVLKVASGKGVTVGPILLGAAKSVHILSPSATVRRIVNMTALAAAQVV